MSTLGLQNKMKNNVPWLKFLGTRIWADGREVHYYKHTFEPIQSWPAWMVRNLGVRRQF